MGNKSNDKRRKFDLKDKMYILKRIDSGIKKCELAKELNVSQSTLSQILKYREKIEASASNDTSSSPSNSLVLKTVPFNSVGYQIITNSRSDKPIYIYENIDQALFEWYKKTSQTTSIYDFMIREKAVEIGRKLGHRNIDINEYWIERFCNRFKIELAKKPNDELPSTSNVDDVNDDDDDTSSLSSSSSIQFIEKINDNKDCESQNISENVENMCTEEVLIKEEKNKNPQSEQQLKKISTSDGITTTSTITTPQVVRLVRTTKCIPNQILGSNTINLNINKNKEQESPIMQRKQTTIIQKFPQTKSATLEEMLEFVKQIKTYLCLPSNNVSPNLMFYISEIENFFLKKALDEMTKKN